MHSMTYKLRPHNKVENKRNDWRCKFRCVGIAELNVFRNEFVENDSDYSRIITFV